jgi:hypothetical protein
VGDEAEGSARGKSVGFKGRGEDVTLYLQGRSPRGSSFLPTPGERRWDREGRSGGVALSQLPR